jgi:hypothetical protein
MAVAEVLEFGEFFWAARPNSTRLVEIDPGTGVFLVVTAKVD